MKNLFFLIFLSFVVLSSTAFCQSDSVAYDSDTLEEAPVFLSPDFDYLKKVVDDPSSAFYYPALLKRFLFSSCSDPNQILPSSLSSLCVSESFSVRSSTDLC